MTDRVVEHPTTGEVVEFVDDDGEVLTMLVSWPPNDRRVAGHRHPGMQESWTVLEGRAAFDVDGVRVDAGPGTTVVAPAGRPHRAWNPGVEPARLRIEMRPGLRWEQFVRRLFAGDDPIALLAAHPDEIELG